jgi:hypothetical protein
MQFLIILFQSLLFHVFRNTFLATKFTNGIDEISLRPKLTAPKRLLHRWLSPEYLAGRYTLDRLYNLLRTIHRDSLNQKMNVILIYSYFQKTNLISLRYLQTNILQLIINFVRKNHAPILRRTYQMVQ